MHCGCSLLRRVDDMKVRLEGNHSAYHCGSAAVWRSMLRAVEEQGAEVTSGDDYDLLIVNGEGSMHHGGATFCKKMELLRGALEAGKRASLVNSVWQDNPPDFDDVLSALDVVTVREVRSRNELFDRHKIEAQVRPDLCIFDEPARQSLSPTGERVATDFYVAPFGNFARMTGGPITELPYVDMKTMDWATLLDQLAAGVTLVTGRHHGVYAACCARVPFICTPGNTHKIEGLFESAGVTGLMRPTPAAALAAAEDAHERYAEAYGRLHAWLDGFSLSDAVTVR